MVACLRGEMRVTLIGFMGSGKSTVAPLLAGQLGWRALELDDLVVQSSGEASVADIFSKFGEEYFREIESRCLHSLTARQEVVVSAGGGVVLRPENIAALKEHGGKAVYLQVAFDEIKRRLAGSSGRPLFQEESRAAELYSKRLPLYEQAADLTVVAGGQPPEAAALQILEWLKDGTTC